MGVTRASRWKPTAASGRVSEGCDLRCAIARARESVIEVMNKDLSTSNV
jgi:hypothetical protein